jgi:hypothetical protein
LKKRYQNGFFIFGLLVLIIMVTQLDFAAVWQGLKHAGYWFFAVVALWAALYVFNTAAWYLIIKGVCSNDPDGKSPRPAPVSFIWLYKVTVSGFALNYATPGGLMGGEPYRIMELDPKIGTERASSTVILYAMTHIFSHFCFWMGSVFLFLATRPVNLWMGMLLLAISAFCVLGLWFFIAGYRKGLANRMLKILRHIPVVKRWAAPFIDRHRQQLDNIDQQTAALHRQNPRYFFFSVALEFLCRIISALEIYFVLLVIMPEADYLSCILILAFTSLFANLLFFLPLQLGGREGGFLMSAAGLGLSASAGIFVALIVRLRELVWTGIGLLFIKIQRNTRQNC